MTHPKKQIVGSLHAARVCALEGGTLTSSALGKEEDVSCMGLLRSCFSPFRIRAETKGRVEELMMLLREKTSQTF